MPVSLLTPVRLPADNRRGHVLDCRCHGGNASLGGGGVSGFWNSCLGGNGFLGFGLIRPPNIEKGMPLS
jgi:hypothetical protein